VVSGAWVRPPTSPGLPAAGYLVIRNPGGQPETLTAASSLSAGSVEMHKTTTMSGMTGMEPVSAIHIPAGGTVTLEPGGFHLMLMNPKPMAVGDTIELVLTFEKAGTITVKAEVKNG
jgi:copper(I)-binding protein